jgi:hypothetical protein
MLTENQTNAIAKCIEIGNGPKFAFVDAIIDHLQITQMEMSLFGVNMESEDHTVVPTEEAFVHHAMHWAFQLGVGAALSAVGKDMSSDNVE